MDNIDHLTALGLFDARVPRYTSYPTAPAFSTATNTGFQKASLKALDPNVPVSVYVHIPFCERLCWFCACRTQGTRTLSPVENYLNTLKSELRLVADLVPSGLRMGRLHWGGGTPTILPASMINDLADAIKTAIPPADDFEFSVEIDPTMVDDTKINALAAQGMNRASIGIQDFSPVVQAAIGREQPYDLTEKCVQSLRQAGIASLNTDLVYGLPHQTPETIQKSIEKVITLDPDRVALFGYAHVPHMAKRQKLIDETALPGDHERYGLAIGAAAQFQAAGYEAIGIDHFSKPDDTLARAVRKGTLRRNFQGYTTDTCPTLIGLGASSISRFSQGYVQNASATAAYIQRIEADTLAGFRGHEHSGEDVMRARAIEMLMCDFRIDFTALQDAVGPDISALAAINDQIVAGFPGLVSLTKTGLQILPKGRPVTRLIARLYDQYTTGSALFSKAS